MMSEAGDRKARKADRKTRTQRLIAALLRLPPLRTTSGFVVSSSDVKEIWEIGRLHELGARTSRMAMQAHACPAPHPLYGDDGHRDHLYELADEALAELEDRIAAHIAERDQ